MKDFSRVMTSIIRSFLFDNLNTCEPGSIEQYFPEKKRANIRPLLQRTYKDGTTDKRPLLLNVPIKQVSTSNFMVHVPLSPGDEVMIFYTKGSIKNFKERWGKDVPTVIGGNFSINNAVAIPWGKEDIDPVSTTGVVIQNRSGKTFFRMTDDEILMKVGRWKRAATR